MEEAEVVVVDVPSEEARPKKRVRTAESRRGARDGGSRDCLYKVSLDLTDYVVVD